MFFLWVLHLRPCESPMPSPPSHLQQMASNMDVSENRGFPPKSSILIGFSIIFTIHFGGKPPIFGNTLIYTKRHIYNATMCMYELFQMIGGVLGLKSLGLRFFLPLPMSMVGLRKPFCRYKVVVHPHYTTKCCSWKTIRYKTVGHQLAKTSKSSAC